MTENKRFKLIDNHLIKYDGDYFDLHKPSDIRSLIRVLNYVTNENEQLKQELFESEVNYFLETYHDNPMRAEQHIDELKEDFKERFGKEFEYETF